MSIYKEHSDNTEINFKELIALIKDNIIFILSSVFIITAVTAAISLTFDNIYRSQAVLTLSNNDNSSNLSSVVGSNSGLLGSLSGNFLPNLGSNNENAITAMRSKDFFNTLYIKNDFLPYLMATKKYDPKSLKTSIDPKKYDVKNKKWVRKVTFPKQVKPSLQEAHKFFMDSLTIVEDNKKNIIIISFDHKSGVIAKEYLEVFINEFNDYVRDKDINKAQKGIQYIESKLRDEKINEIRNVLAAVMEKDIQTLSLAEKTEEFVLEIIDSPYIPEIKLKPKRSLLCIFAALITGVFSTLLVFVLNLYGKRIYYKNLFFRIDNV